MTDKISKECLEYLNQIRQNPKIAIQHLQEQLTYIKGKLLTFPGQTPIKTNEGAAAWNECIKFLEKQQPIAPLKLDATLTKAAKSHCDDLGPKGQFGHSSSDGTSMEDRLAKFGDWDFKVGENICYSSKTGQTIVLQLIVDDGLPSRGHRANCFNEDFKVVGIATGPHKNADSMTTFDLASDFTPLGAPAKTQSQAPSARPTPQKGQQGGLLPDQQETLNLAPPKRPQPAQTQAALQTKPAPANQKTVNGKAFDPNKYVKPTLPIDEVNDIKQAFDIFDSDGSGAIDPKELKEAFEQLGFSGNSKFIYQVLAELDENNSGDIEFDEFLQMATSKPTDKDNKEQIRKIFNFYDVNREGKIQFEELVRVAHDLGEDMTDDEVFAMFKKADLDDDGLVTFDDFYNLMTGKVYWDQ